MIRMNLNLALRPLTQATHFQYGVWDCEASNWWDLQVIGAFDGTDYFQFRTVPEFLDHILRWEYRHWRWFAHFGGRYDLNFVFDYLQGRSDCKVSFYCSGSMVENCWNTMNRIAVDCMKYLKSFIKKRG